MSCGPLARVCNRHISVSPVRGTLHSDIQKAIDRSEEEIPPDVPHTLSLLLRLTSTAIPRRRPGVTSGIRDGVSSALLYPARVSVRSFRSERTRVRSTTPIAGSIRSTNHRERRRRGVPAYRWIPSTWRRRDGGRTRGTSASSPISATHLRLGFGIDFVGFGGGTRVSLFLSAHLLSLARVES